MNKKEYGIGDIVYIMGLCADVKGLNFRPIECNIIDKRVSNNKTYYKVYLKTKSHPDDSCLKHLKKDYNIIELSDYQFFDTYDQCEKHINTHHKNNR